jgi:hypothetical protein
MKRLLSIILMLAIPSGSFAAGCRVQLVPPTVNSLICEDVNGSIVMDDASSFGPATIRSIGNFGSYNPQGITAVSSMTTISPVANYLTLVSTGGVVTVGGTVASISTATAFNGQMLILGATQGVNIVVITSSTASGCDLGAATRSIGYGKRLGLIFDSATSIWTELFYGNN